MGIREQAQADLAITLEAGTEFGRTIVLTAPNGFSSAVALQGQTQDIGAALDPDTGVTVSARTASITLQLATLVSEDGYPSFPEGIADSDSLPWTVLAEGQLWKIQRTMPDRTLDVVVCILEFYENA